jgi:hypothetical protein
LNHIDRALTPDVEKQASLRLGAGSCAPDAELVAGLTDVRSDEGEGESAAIDEEQAVESSRIETVSTR